MPTISTMKVRLKGTMYSLGAINSMVLVFTSGRLVGSP